MLQQESMMTNISLAIILDLFISYNALIKVSSYTEHFN